jgi:hypothetical protein
LGISSAKEGNSVTLTTTGISTGYPAKTTNWGDICGVANSFSDGTLKYLSGGLAISGESYTTCTLTLGTF